MAKYYTSINSFADAELAYNNTRPVNERDYGTKYDLRPIGDRARKWEHIIKIDKFSYGLFDYNYGDPCGWHARYNDLEYGVADMKRMAPILWEKLPDGRELMYVRNGTGQSMHAARYDFLERVLPSSMRLLVRGGKQYVSYLGKNYFLAKRKVLPKLLLDRMRNDSSHIYNGVRWYEEKQWRDDGAQLVFEYKAGSYSYELVRDGKEEPKPPKVKVLKDKKKKHKQAIEEFWKYVCTMTPMISMDWGYVRDMRAELCAINGVHYNHWERGTLPIPDKFVLNVLNKYNNDYWLHLAVDFVARSDIKDVSNTDDIKRVRAQFNRWINSMCGFTTTK